MRGPRGPSKTLKAAQAVIIGISEPKEAKADPTPTQLLYHTSNLSGVHADPAYSKT